MCVATSIPIAGQTINPRPLVKIIKKINAIIKAGVIATIPQGPAGVKKNAAEKIIKVIKIRNVNFVKLITTPVTHNMKLGTLALFFLYLFNTI